MSDRWDDVDQLTERRELGEEMRRATLTSYEAIIEGVREDCARRVEAWAVGLDAIARDIAWRAADVIRSGQ